jgi:hypothetical protein
MCNRDERLTRKRALSPSVRESRKVRFISPSDGDHGGSWIGVNDCGVALCLLNRYQDQKSDPASSFTSRGLLVAELLDSSSQTQAQSRIIGRDLAQFQPFTLAVLEAGKDCLLIEWNGRNLFARNGEEAMPLVSSSIDQEGATRARQRLFEEIEVIDASSLLAFHRSHAPARGPHSPCMHREDARTVSFSRIEVAARSISFFYLANSPCAASLENDGETVTIERAKR